MIQRRANYFATWRSPPGGKRHHYRVDGCEAARVSSRLRLHLTAAIVRALSPRRCMTIPAASKIRGLSVYDTAAPAGYVMRKNARKIRGQHRGGGGGALRAVNDGLVSNACLILGVARAGAEPLQRPFTPSGKCQAICSKVTIRNG